MKIHHCYICHFTKNMPLQVRRVGNPFNPPKFTHFIRFPLLNQSSSPQVQETLWRVANDPVSASIPPSAYRPLQRLGLTIAALQLPTYYKTGHAIKLLHNLGNRDWRKLYSQRYPAPSYTPITSTVNPPKLSRQRVGHFNIPPLVVSALFEATFPSTYHLRVPCLCREQDARHAEWGR